MNELAHEFGNDVSLIGVVTQPDDEQANGKAPAIILLNSGLLPHTGPYRLHVELARKLADSGFTCLRFDLSGIGDSGKRQDVRPHTEQVADDISDAMDFLTEQYDINQFVLAGICTGADNAHRQTVADPRVIGNICIDGYAYPTLKYYFRKYLAMVIQSKNWIKLYKRLLGKLGINSAEKPLVEDMRTMGYYWDLPARDKVESEFLILVERKVKMFWIYSSEWDYNYTTQLEDTFKNVDFRGQLSVKYLPTSDHTHSFIKCREELVESVNAWMQKSFG